MSHVDPAHDLTDAGVAGDPNRAPGRGTAEVHSRITGGGSAYDAGAEGSRHARSPSDEENGRLDDLRDRAGELGDRAGEWASRARRGMDDTLHRMEERLHLADESGIVTAIRGNPILAAGLAFGVGFLLAGSRRPRSGLIGAATGQLRGAVIGGITAAITQELRELFDEHGGVSGLFASVGGREHEEDERGD